MTPPPSDADESWLTRLRERFYSRTGGGGIVRGPVVRTGQALNLGFEPVDLTRPFPLMRPGRGQKIDPLATERLLRTFWGASLEKRNDLWRLAEENVICPPEVFGRLYSFIETYSRGKDQRILQIVTLVGQGNWPKFVSKLFARNSGWLR